MPIKYDCHKALYLRTQQLDEDGSWTRVFRIVVKTIF